MSNEVVSWALVWSHWSREGIEMNTTIAALATAPAPSGVAVVRVSGPQARTVSNSLIRSSERPTDLPRKLILGELLDAHARKPIDQVLAVFMSAPNSFTGEDVLEIHCHGSPVLVQRILRELFAFGVVPAEAGEFSKRAFLNGKIDLVQAEAIAEVISATSERTLAVAQQHLRGELSSLVGEIGEPLRDILAEIEAAIDFPEEEIEPASYLASRKKVAQCVERLEALVESSAYGEVLREGFKVLLCGPPNVGKSSLLNALLGRERAIVTEISGTTRDLIEEDVLWDGYQFILCDSAGLTETTDVVEKIGIELAEERVEWADVVLLVVDATTPEQDWRTLLSRIHSRAREVWLVTNKIDLNAEAIGKFYCEAPYCTQNFYISVRNGDGLPQLKQSLIEAIHSRAESIEDANQIVTKERHRHCLSSALLNLRNALDAFDRTLPLEVVSSEIRLGLSALDELIGRTYTEDILGRVFSKFCIGK